MELVENKPRRLLLSGEITNASVQAIINQIIEINYDDDLKQEVYVDYLRLPIILFINSPGGNVYDGLALVDVIRQSRTQVYTVALGHTMSMGFWIYLAGHKRFVGEHSTIMYHEISTGCWDKIEGIELNVKEAKRLQKFYDKEIINSSNIDQATLDDYKKRKAEWYIPAKEAIKLGLALTYYTDSIEFDGIMDDFNNKK